MELSFIFFTDHAAEMENKLTQTYDLNLQTKQAYAPGMMNVARMFSHSF